MDDEKKVSTPTANEEEEEDDDGLESPVETLAAAPLTETVSIFIARLEDAASLCCCCRCCCEEEEEDEESSSSLLLDDLLPLEEPKGRAEQGSCKSRISDRIKPSMECMIIMFVFVCLFV